MAGKILFQRDRLTVSESNLTVGPVTAFYPNISAISIYDGRPLLTSALLSAIGLIPGVFMFFMFRRLVGAHFPIKIITLLCFPFVTFVIFGIWYRVRCLFVTIDGQAVAVLKAKDVSVLEQAKTTIEAAKLAAESHSRNCETIPL